LIAAWTSSEGWPKQHSGAIWDHRSRKRAMSFGVTVTRLAWIANLFLRLENGVKGSLHHVEHHHQDVFCGILQGRDSVLFDVNGTRIQVWWLPCSCSRTNHCIKRVFVLLDNLLDDFTNKTMKIGRGQAQSFSLLQILIIFDFTKSSS